MNKFILILFTTLLTSIALKAQKNYRALFLGNSYTGTNNLPQMVADLALSVGDTLIFDSNTPGGYRLLDHGATGSLSRSKIQAGGWDYVILQEQSRTPILWNNQFTSGGSGLNNIIREDNPCSETILYMTWGRKNGDASNCPSTPVMCTYEGMDSTLRNKYLDLAADISAEVSPVSIVWNHLRQNNPSIELYHPDGSHPSLAGTYAAACCFYATLFKKDPSLITFDGGISASDASSIRNAAKILVFNNLSLWDYKQKDSPKANIIYHVTSSVTNEVFFLSQHTAENYFWDFGDGTTSTSRAVSHTYLSDGAYTVTLKTSNCSLKGLDTSLIADTVVQFCSHTPTIVMPNPLCQHDTAWTQSADAYQWFDGGMLIPETNQYVANHGQYSFNFKVATTVNGCTEMSKGYSSVPQSLGYYFDAYHYGNDPCVGDTVNFAVLHINGSLPGSENIEWYKDGVLLPSFANEDTLLITSGGTYECRIVAPNSNCPIDTTLFSAITFNCGTTSVENVEKEADLFWSIFPNPASKTITIKFTQDIMLEPIQIYNIMGHLVKEEMANTTTELIISDLPNGVYFIRLKNSSQAALKFIKQ